MKKLTSEEKYKIEREIEYWSFESGFDKFIYGSINSIHFGLLAIIIPIFIFINNIYFVAKWSLFYFYIIVLPINLIILGWIIIASLYFKKLRNKQLLSFTAREKVIEKKYSLLGVSKEELNKEHEAAKFELIKPKLLKKFT